MEDQCEPVENEENKEDLLTFAGMRVFRGGSPKQMTEVSSYKITLPDVVAGH